MKKHGFLETMSAKEFCECLQDFGLYNVAIDTMVSTIENQGRCVNEAINTLPHRQQIPVEINPDVAEGAAARLYHSITTAAAFESKLTRSGSILL